MRGFIIFGFLHQQTQAEKEEGGLKAEDERQVGKGKLWTGDGPQDGQGMVRLRPALIPSGAMTRCLCAGTPRP